MRAHFYVLITLALATNFFLPVSAADGVRSARGRLRQKRGHDHGEQRRVLGGRVPAGASTADDPLSQNFLETASTHRQKWGTVADTFQDMLDRWTGRSSEKAAAAEAVAASSFEQQCRKSGRSLANLTATRDVGLFNIASLKLVPDMAGEHWDLNDQRRCMISFDTPPSRSEEQRPRKEE